MSETNEYFARRYFARAWRDAILDRCACEACKDSAHAMQGAVSDLRSRAELGAAACALVFWRHARMLVRILEPALVVASLKDRDAVAAGTEHLCRVARGVKP